MSTNTRQTETQPEKSSSAGPVGRGDYVVKEGDSIESIAFEKGFFYDTIWNHPANAELKQKRTHRNELLPGDRVTIPEKTLKELPRPTGKLHTFRKKGVPALYRLQLFVDDKPRANESYVLKIEGQVFTGKTNEQGMLEYPVPPDAKSGTLTIGPEETNYILNFGVLHPVSEISGIQKRLTNLGYDCTPHDGELNDKTSGALVAFQRAYELKITGKPDPATVRKLDEIHQLQHG